MRTGKDRVRVEEIGGPVSIGGVRVEPGDLLLGDGDGLVAVPAARADEVIAAAIEIERAEEAIRDAIAGGAEPPRRARRGRATTRCSDAANTEPHAGAAAKRRDLAARHAACSSYHRPMELRHLRYFVAVAEDMHFGRAAKRLHIVQPALSKQIAALERELGVTLFSRTKHRIEFTPAGQAFFEEALDILRRVDHATRTAKMTETGAVGSLDIGFIGPAMLTVLPPLLREHRRRLSRRSLRVAGASAASPR